MEIKIDRYRYTCIHINITRIESTGTLTRVCPEVHFKAGLPFEFFLANLTLVHRSFIPERKHKNI
jgi:hypothetical protein